MSLGFTVVSDWRIYERVLLLHVPCEQIGDEYVEEGHVQKFGEGEDLHCEKCGKTPPQEIMDALSLIPSFGFGCWSEGWVDWHRTRERDSCVR